MTFPLGLYLIVGGSAAASIAVATLKRSDTPTARALLRQVIALPKAGIHPVGVYLRASGRLFVFMAALWLVGMGGLMWSDEFADGSMANTVAIGIGLFFLFGGFFAMWHAFSQLRRAFAARRRASADGDAV